MHGPGAGILVCALLGAGACDPLQRPASEAGGPGGTDAAVFAVLVETLRGEAEGTSFLVDRRPIRERVGLYRAEPDVMAARARVLGRAGVAETDFDRDARCFPAIRWHDLDGAPVPDRVAAIRRACSARPPFTSVSIGLPEGGGEGEVFVPAVRATRTRYLARGFHLRRDPAGRWMVTQVDTLMDDGW